MTKADIVEFVYNRIGGISKKESADLVEKLIALIKSTISDGENLKVTGFGHFIVKDKKARKGINPQTKKQIVLPGHKVLKFRVSQVLRNGINKDYAGEAGVIKEAVGDAVKTQAT